MEQTLHAPCPKCGGQPEATKGKTYWTAACPKQHFPGRVLATPMKTKAAALAAWDAEYKHARSE